MMMRAIYSASLMCSTSVHAFSRDAAFRFKPHHHLRISPAVGEITPTYYGVVKGRTRALSGAMSTMVDRTHEARDESVYEPLGNKGYKIDPMVVGKIVNPALTGDGPMWPNMRQAHKVLRLCGKRNRSGESRVLVVSDGLADPCDPKLGFDPDTKLSGFGYEVLGEFCRSTKKKNAADDDYSASFQPFGGWETMVADKITQHAAIAPTQIHTQMDEWGVISAEIQIFDSWNCPDHFVKVYPNDFKTIACLLFWSRAPWLPTGGEALSFPDGSFRLLCFRLVTPEQMAQIMEAGDEDDTKQARIDVVKGWETDGSHHVTDISP